MAHRVVAHPCIPAVRELGLQTLTPLLRIGYQRRERRCRDDRECGDGAANALTAQGMEEDMGCLVEERRCNLEGEQNEPPAEDHGHETRQELDCCVSGTTAQQRKIHRITSTQHWHTVCKTNSLLSYENYFVKSIWSKKQDLYAYVKKLISRNFCQKQFVRVKFCNFHTVLYPCISCNNLQVKILVFPRLSLTLMAFNKSSVKTLLLIFPSFFP